MLVFTKEQMTCLLANQPSCSPVTVNQSPSTIDEYCVPRVLALLSTKLHARFVLRTFGIPTDGLAVQASITATKRIKSLTSYL